MKYNFELDKEQMKRSPSLRGRGLKSFYPTCKTFHKFVALFTRAWIEISPVSVSITVSVGRPLYEGVD